MIGELVRGRCPSLMPEPSSEEIFQLDRKQREKAGREKRLEGKRRAVRHSPCRIGKICPDEREQLDDEEQEEKLDFFRSLADGFPYPGATEKIEDRNTLVDNGDYDANLPRAM